jgi:hypothetical protein
MKKFFLITVTIIIITATVITGTGCKANAAMGPTRAEFIGSDFEISLPENWEGGKKSELDSVADNLKEAGRTQLAEDVLASRRDLLFFAYDSETAAGGGNVSNLTIGGEPAGSLSLEDYIELSYKNMSDLYEEAGHEFTIIEEGIVSTGNYDETGRVIFEQTVKGSKTKVIQYIIGHESDFWVLTFTAEPEYFEENIEDFESTFESFKILK